MYPGHFDSPNMLRQLHRWVQGPMMSGVPTETRKVASTPGPKSSMAVLLGAKTCDVMSSSAAENTVN